MKKFLKFLIVTIVVVVAIIGACVLFFQNKSKVENSTTSLLGFLKNENKTEFDKNLSNVSNLVNYDNLDERFNLIIDINENLDNSFAELTSYLIEDEVKVESKEISTNLYTVLSLRNHSKVMMQEYNIKANHKVDGNLSLFDRHIGANDLYKTMLNYAKNYAKLVSSLNDYLDSVVDNKLADLKFNMIEIYTRIVRNTLNSTENNSSNWVVLKSVDNLNVLTQNNVLNFKNSFIDVNANIFSSTVSNFNNYFEQCDKVEFCNNLATNIQNIEELSEGLKTHEIATYWFEEVVGI